MRKDERLLPKIDLSFFEGKVVTKAPRGKQPEKGQLTPYTFNLLVRKGFGQTILEPLNAANLAKPTEKEIISAGKTPFNRKGIGPTRLEEIRKALKDVAGE